MFLQSNKLTLELSIKSIGVLLVVGLILLNFWMVSDFSGGHIRADHWRHFRQILIPVAEGEADFRIFWANHHPNPMLHFYEILIADPVFGYDLRLDGLVSFSLHVCIYLMIMWSVSSLLDQGFRDSIVSFSGIIIGLYWFSIPTVITFGWTLVSLQSLGYIFGIIAIATVAKAAVRGFALKETVVAALFCSLGIFLNFDYGILFFVAVAGILFILVTYNSCVSKIREKSPFFSLKGVNLNALRFLIVYTAVALLTIAFITVFLLTTYKNSALTSDGITLKMLLEFIEGSARSISSALIGENVFRDFYKESPSVIRYIGVWVPSATYMLICFVAMVRLRFKALPYLALAAYPVLFGLAVFLSREANDFSLYLSYPRYATNFRLGWIGAFVLATQIVLSFDKVKFEEKHKIAVGVLLTVCMAVWSTHISYKAKEKFAYVELSADRNELVLYMTGTDPVSDIRLDRAILGSARDYQDSLDFLVENELNVFSPRYGQSDMLKDYKEGFAKTVDAPIVNFIISKTDDRAATCIELSEPIRALINYGTPGTKSRRAWINIRMNERRHAVLLVPGTSQLPVYSENGKLELCGVRGYNLVRSE